MGSSLHLGVHLLPGSNVIGMDSDNLEALQTRVDIIMGGGSGKMIDRESAECGRRVGRMIEKDDWLTISRQRCIGSVGAGRVPYLSTPPMNISRYERRANRPRS